MADLTDLFESLVDLNESDRSISVMNDLNDKSFTGRPVPVSPLSEFPGSTVRVPSKGL